MPVCERLVYCTGRTLAQRVISPRETCTFRLSEDSLFILSPEHHGNFNISFNSSRRTMGFPLRSSQISKGNEDAAREWAVCVYRKALFGLMMVHRGIKLLYLIVTVVLLRPEVCNLPHDSLRHDSLRLSLNYGSKHSCNQH